MVVGTITGGRKLRDTARLLREAGRRDLGRELTATLKQVPGPIVADLKAAVEKVPIRGYAKPGARSPYTAKAPARHLRATIARAIDSAVTTSGNYPKITIRVAGTKLPASLLNMPRKLDDPAGWRHPVQGNREVWVRQAGAPWWWAAIKPHLEDVRAQASEAIDRVAAKIEKG